MLFYQIFAKEKIITFGSWLRNVNVGKLAYFRTGPVTGTLKHRE